MANVVTGISPSGDLGALEAALRDAGLGLEPLDVIEPDGTSAPLSSGVIRQNIGPIETGTGVPGLSRGGSSIPNSVYLRESPVAGRLGDLGIPDDELDNYLDALDADRSIVAYRATPETVAAAEAAFAAAGLAKVKRF